MAIEKKFLSLSVDNFCTQTTSKKMIKFIKHLALLLVTIGTFVACEKDDNGKNVVSDSVRISAFSLKSDSTILENLENVFFTIDLENGLIYNADSLPKGTDVSALKFNITTENASAINITTIDTDTAYNYLKHENKTNNLFAPANIEVVSKSGRFKKNYQLKVNVHKLDPDQMYWGGVQYSSLPGEGSLKAQQTVKYQELIYCFMTRDDKHLLATTTHPSHDWQITQLDLSFAPNWQSLRAGNEIISVLDNNNTLYTSIDGINWENTNKKYVSIVGCIGTEILTITQDGENYYHDKYPQPEGFTPQLISAKFPIEGFSDMVTYNSPWLTHPQCMIVGGRTADGNLTGALWGYDGNTWALLNNQISAREGASFFTYVTFFTDDYWVTSELPTWFVLGGLNEQSALRDIWVSNNYGITWQKAESTLMIPGYISSRGYASVVVCDEPANTTYATWQSVDMLPIPEGYRQIPAYSSTEERLVPYIYMFGGSYTIGKTYDQIWRGTINRLRFEPIP